MTILQPSIGAGGSGKGYQSQDYLQRIEKARRWMEDHLSETFSLEEVAEAAAFSKFHFHRIYTAMTGETPAEYVRRLRLEMAAHLLAFRPDLSVTQVGATAGFSTPSAFARDFRSRFGVTPRTYRSSPGQAVPAPPLPAPGKSFAWKLSRISDLRLAEAREEGPYHRAAGLAWNRLFRSWLSAGQKDLPQVCWGIPWDNPGITDHSRCRYSACLALKPGGPVPPGLRELKVSGGPCLELEYTGRREDMGQAYDYLYSTALPQSGFLPGEFPALERYSPPYGKDTLSVTLLLPLV